MFGRARMTRSEVVPSVRSEFLSDVSTARDAAQ